MPFPKAHLKLNMFENHAWYVPGVADIFILLALLLAGSLLGSIVTALFTSVAPQAAPEYSLLLAYPLQFLPAIMFAARRSSVNSVNKSGFRLDSAHFEPLGWLVCGLLAIVGTLAASFASDSVSALLPPMPEWLDSVLESMTGGVIWVDFVCVSIMAPIFEEWLCRGMILRGLLNSGRTRPVWAIVISAAFFALIHMNPWQAIPAFLLGCLFGYVYYKTGSLKLTMLMHFTNNTMALVLSNIPSLDEAENWTDILGGAYWIYFVLALAVLALVLTAFRRIRTASPSGNCDRVPSLFEDAV